jgi:hypothetical protein
LKNHLYNALVTKNKEENAGRQSSRIRASMLHMCERKLVYQALDYPKTEHDPKLLVTFGLGTQFHEFVQSTLVSAGVLTNCEEEVSCPELFLKGHMDGKTCIDEENNVIKIPKSGPNAIFEFKTMNNDMFSSLLFKDAPKPEHVLQVNTYMHLSGFDKAVILYSNKNGTLPRSLLADERYKFFLKEKDAYCLDFVVDYKPSLWNFVVEKLTRVNKFIDNCEGKPKEEHELPPKLETYSECNSCQFKPICRTGRKKKGEV